MLPSCCCAAGITLTVAARPAADHRGETGTAAILRAVGVDDAVLDCCVGGGEADLTRHPGGNPATPGGGCEPFRAIFISVSDQR
jgi:hypothetical protein